MGLECGLGIWVFGPGDWPVQLLGPGASPYGLGCWTSEWVFEEDWFGGNLRQHCWNLG